MPWVYPYHCLQGSTEGECSSPRLSPRLTFRKRLVNTILGLKSPSVQSVSVPADYLSDYSPPQSRGNRARAPRPISWGCVCTVAHSQLPYPLVSYLLGPTITFRVALSVCRPCFKLQNRFQLLSYTMKCGNLRGQTKFYHLAIDFVGFKHLWFPCHLVTHVVIYFLI